MKSSDMSALVVGLGSIGTRHINNLYDLGVTNLSAFRSRNLPTPAEVKAENVAVYNDYDEALSSTPDIVVIANPTSFHAPFAKKALEAGCHVYMEKPVSHEIDGANELLRIAGEKELTVGVGCQHRFDKNMEDIKEWIDEGRIGKVLTVNIDVGEYLPGWHPWEDYRGSYAGRVDMGGGVILTMIHDIDYLYWLTGPVQRVYAEGGQITPLEIDAEDTAMISLSTESGVRAHLRMDYWRDPAVRTMNIVGEEGEIDWNYHSGKAVLKKKGDVVQVSERDTSWERNDLFTATMTDFLEAIAEEREPRVSLRDGVEVLKTALAAKESIQKHEVITI